MKYSIFFFLILFATISNGQTDVTGKQLFRENCKACHNIDRKLVGPALKGIHERRDSAWTYQFIMGSTAMINAGDSTANALFLEYNKVTMPDQNVTPDEIDLILAYIKEASSAPADAAPFSRPEVKYAYNFTPLQFSEFTFWLPFTIFVLILIGALYYQTFMYDIVVGRIKKNKDSGDSDE